MYDIFYVSKGAGNDEDWSKIKFKYPIAQRLKNIKSYEDIRSKTFTKMFWVIWDDIDLEESFNLLEYRATQWDDMYVHVFKNGEHFDGVCLFPKNIQISNREFYHRFFSAKKEIDIIASVPKKYRIYSPTTYEEYQQITDEMFWVVWPEVKIIDQSVFNLYFSHHNSYDRRENHIFKNLCNGIESYLSGIILCSKHKPLSKREFENQYAVDKKEYEHVVSKFQYPIYEIDSYEKYLEIVSSEKQKMFWCRWPEIEIIDAEIFDFYFDPNDGTYDHDRNENHVFKNLCNDDESYLSGLVLFSVSKVISKKEFSRQYLFDKKEHDRVVTRYRYNRYNISNYVDYKNILENETRPLFWGIWPEVEVTDNLVFNTYFDPNDGKYDHDRTENHVFKHLFNNTETYVNGLVLFSKENQINEREFNHRFLINKKEHNRLVSKQKLYDVFFISYDELNADENYQRLLSICPRAKRVHGIKGIHQAHIEAAKQSTTDMFWVVDGDSYIVDNFDFNLVYFPFSYEIDCVHVWKSRNPINELEYGNGGVKLLPKKLTLAVDVTSHDMTTSISKKFKTMNVVSNENRFNTNEFNTWKAAFRECVKLTAKIIPGQVNDETEHRLKIWQTTGIDKLYGRYAIAGAKDGAEFGTENVDSLHMINDFDWLKEIYENKFKKNI